VILEDLFHELDAILRDWTETGVEKGLKQSNDTGLKRGGDEKRGVPLLL
jgi:hypothetical protein